MTDPPLRSPRHGGHDDAGVSSEEPRADQAVVEILRRLGLTEHAARVAALGGEILRRLSAVSESETEFAAVLDDTTGAPLGPHQKGSGHGVDIAPLMEQVLPGRRCIVIHAHPAAASFSLDDATVFVDHHEISVLAAVTNAGSWYAFGDHGTTPRADRATVAHLYSQEVTRLRNPYVRRIARGEISAEAALVELEHDVWTNIAHQIAVRYVRYDRSSE